MKLAEDIFKKYVADPLGMDEVVRTAAKISDSKYYSVVVWPEERAGKVYVIPNSVRVVKAKKVSKSDQTT